MLGAISALVVAVIIYLAELILWDKYNVGVFVVAVTMATVMLAIRAIKLRSKFETVMAILFGVIWLALIVTYVIAINYGWV